MIIPQSQYLECPPIALTTRGIRMATICACSILLHSSCNLMLVTTAGDSPDGVALSLFVYRGCPRAAQWTTNLVMIDLGHVQLDEFSPFYYSRYPISFAGEITCCDTAMHSLTGFSKRLVH